MIQFTNSAWFTWIPLGIAIPVIVHLLSRFSKRQIVLPTLRFIATGSITQASGLRLKNIILMMCRMTTLILLILAFAQPIFVSNGQSQLGSNHRAIVYILDRSASMQRSTMGVSLFDQARQRVIQSLESLREGIDYAAVVVLDKHPNRLLPEFTGNIKGLIELLGQLDCTYEVGRTDIAIRSAIDLFNRHPTLSKDSFEKFNKHVVFISDMQFNSTINYKELFPQSDDIEYMYHIVGHSTNNLSLHTPGVTPSRPVVGENMTLSVQVSNYEYDKRSSSIQVQLKYAGKELSQWVDITNGQDQRVDFHIQPEHSRMNWCQFNIITDHNDGFVHDDTVGMAVHVEDYLMSGLITSSDVNDSRYAAYYLARAQVADHDNGMSTLQVFDVENHHDWNSLKDMSSVTVVEGGELSPSCLQAIRDYVSDGGVLVWVVDSDQAAKSMNDYAILINSDAKVVIDNQAYPTAWRLSNTKAIHPLLNSFEAGARASLLRHRFHSVFGFKGGQSILEYDNGLGAFSYLKYHHGVAVIIGADLAPVHSNLVKGPLIVPLIQEAIRVFRDDAQIVRSINPGDRIIFDTTEYESYHDSLSVLDPENNIIHSQLMANKNDRMNIVTDTIDSLGRYRVLNDIDKVELDGVWVEVDRKECDFRNTWIQDFDALPNNESNQGHDMDLNILTDRSIELWPYCVVGALVLMMCEGFAVKYY